jgi:AcrR family transcriptional regulator
MASRTPYPEAARELLRQTLFDAARHHLESRPWAEVTMGDIAATAGVSRQTLYKEFGNKSEFAVALTIHEGERFLGAVEDAVRAHTDNPRDAIRAALELFLRTAGEDPLIRTVLSDDGSGGSGGMLPFVTTQGMPVVVWATARLSAVIEEGWPQAGKGDVKLLAEALVRLAISYITTPAETPDSTAASVADLLGPFIDRALGTA